MHTTRLQREQPVCRFKAKTLISLRTNETTQTTIFSIGKKNAFTLKTTLQPVFHNNINRFLNFSYISSTPTWIRCPVQLLLTEMDEKTCLKWTAQPGITWNCQVNNRNTRTRCEICSKLIIKTPERPDWYRSGVFVVNFEHVSYLDLVFLLLPLTK